MLSTMLFADEIVPRAAVEELAEEPAEVSDKELAIAEQLVDSLSAEWDPERYTDTYRERVLGSRAAPRPRAARSSSIELPEPAARVDDLMAALEASLAAATQAGRRARRPAPPRSRAGSGSQEGVTAWPYAPGCGEAHPRNRAGPDAARAGAARDASCAPSGLPIVSAHAWEGDLDGMRARDFAGIVPLGRLDAIVGRGAAALPSARARAAARGRRRRRAGDGHLPRRPVAGAGARGRGAAGRAARGGLARRSRPRPRRPTTPCSRTCASPWACTSGTSTCSTCRRAPCAWRAASRARTRPSATASARGACSSTPRSTSRSTWAGSRTTRMRRQRWGSTPTALEAAVEAGSPQFTEPLFGAFCSVCVGRGG